MRLSDLSTRTSPLNAFPREPVGHADQDDMPRSLLPSPFAMLSLHLNIIIVQLTKASDEATLLLHSIVE